MSQTPGDRQTDPENGDNRSKTMGPVFSAPVSKGNYYLKIFQSSLNLLAYILIGMTIGVLLAFSFLSSLPLGATPMHIVLCVIGYQLLMSVAILSLTSESGWSAQMKLVHKRRAHTILQISGACLAIAGSFIKILDKEQHWNTLHGQFALVALVFTTVSLVNGLASLYAYELRKFLPGSISKLTHICFGSVAFAAANICLCYGIDKTFFRNWITSAYADTLIGFIACFTFIILINPTINFVSKFVNVVKK